MFMISCDFLLRPFFFNMFRISIFWILGKLVVASCHDTQSQQHTQPLFYVTKPRNFFFDLDMLGSKKSCEIYVENKVEHVHFKSWQILIFIFIYLSCNIWASSYHLVSGIYYANRLWETFETVSVVTAYSINHCNCFYKCCNSLSLNHS